MQGRVLVMASVVVFAGLVGVVPATAQAGTLPGVTVGDVSVWEGNAGQVAVKVPIDLSVASATTVTMRYSITSDSPTADGSDFGARSGNLSFPAGVASKQLSVVVYGDTNPEPDEHVAVHLSSIVGAVPEKPDGGVTILDDDSGSSGLGVQVEIGRVSVVEADAGHHVANLPVTLSVPAPTTVRVAYSLDCATATSSDYSSRASGNITFLLGQRSKVLSFTIAADTKPEVYIKDVVKHISVVLGPAVVRDSQGETVIVDNDVAAPTHAPSTVSIERANVATDGTEGDAPPVNLCNPDGITASAPPFIGGSAMTSDGRYVAFASSASNLVPGDTNGLMDVFVRDLLNHTTERVSVQNDGSQFTSPYPWWGGASRPAITSDGRYVTFYSGAGGYLYVRDRVAGTTTKVSPNTPASTPASISDDGRSIVYQSFSAQTADPWPLDSNGGPASVDAVYLWDRDTNSTRLIDIRSPELVNGASYDFGQPKISGNGRFVAFNDGTDTLVPGDTNGCADTFVRDLVTGSTERVSILGDGTQQATTWGASCSDGSPLISNDGRYVGFTSAAYNLYPGATSSADLGSGSPANHSYLHDRLTGTTDLLDGGFAPEQGSVGSSVFISAMSDDGRYVVFGCGCGDPVASMPWMNDYVPIWLDRQTGNWHEIGVQQDGTAPLNEDTGGLTHTVASGISSDGATIAFQSEATNLVPDDSNGTEDVFIEHMS